MKPFAVCINEKFVTLNVAPKKPRRYKVDMWFKFDDGEKIQTSVATKTPITFRELINDVITPEVDEMTSEFTRAPSSSGFSCYLWG